MTGPTHMQVPWTPHYAIFVGTAADVAELMKILSRGAEELRASVRKEVQAVEDRVATSGALDANQTKDAVKRIGSGLDAYLGTLGLLTGLMTVVLVTGVETYLTQNLVAIARRDPKLPNKDMQPIGYSQIVDARTIEELHEELRREWARKFLARPPEQWLRKLAGIGLECPTDARQSILHLWDTRNLVVHARGVADSAYVGRYSGTMKNIKVGERVPTTPPLILRWADSIRAFVDLADKFFATYATTPGADRQIEDG